MKKTLGFIGLTTALVLGGQALAHPNWTWEGDDSNGIVFKRVGEFDKIDANGDGIVTRDEYLSFDGEYSDSSTKWREGHWEEMLEDYDGNNDGQLEGPEIEEGIERRVAEAMERVDHVLDKMPRHFEFEFEGDGEWAERLEERLEGLDERIEEALEGLDGYEFDFDFDDHGRRVFIDRKIVGSMPHMAMIAPHGMLDEADENEDGQVSKEEFDRLHEEMFDRLDKNGDGVLDEDELDQRGEFAFKWIEREDDEE